MVPVVYIQSDKQEAKRGDEYVGNISFHDEYNDVFRNYTGWFLEMFYPV